jgi:DNA-3-methyladenine glycosylase II
MERPGRVRIRAAPFVTAGGQPRVLEPRGPYSLAASARFLRRFGPAPGAGAETDGDEHFHLAFLLDGSYEPVAACLREEPSGVAVELIGDVNAHVDADAAGDQVRRILSLDVDATGYDEIGERDGVIGELQARYRGLRPVLWTSPYEAAAWAVISQRVQMAQASKIRERMARELGESVEVHGQPLHVFPAPARLIELDAFPGLFGRKPEWLRGVAEATLDGRLDAQALRGMPPEEALGELKRIPGIGDFAAQLVLLRGAGTVDVLPPAERRLVAGVAAAYALPGPPSADELRAISDAWRPFRTWVAVLLRSALEDDAAPRRRHASR